MSAMRWVPAASRCSASSLHPAEACSPEKHTHIYVPLTSVHTHTPMHMHMQIHESEGRADVFVIVDI